MCMTNFIQSDTELHRGIYYVIHIRYKYLPRFPHLNPSPSIQVINTMNQSGQDSKGGDRKCSVVINLLLHSEGPPVQTIGPC